jgi:tetratricopeptide (TPR) repeat protein
MSYVSMGCVVCHLMKIVAGHQAKFLSQVQAHVQAITSCDMLLVFSSDPRPKIACIFVNCGWLLQWCHADDALSQLLARLFKFLDLDQSVVDEQWIKLYHLYGFALRRRGDKEAAIKIFEEVVQIYQKMSRHSGRFVDALSDLAYAYQSNGQLKSATKLQEEILHFRRETLPDDHRDVLEIQQHLASSYRDNGQITEALELFVDIVGKCRHLSEQDDFLLDVQHDCESPLFR